MDRLGTTLSFTHGMYILLKSGLRLKFRCNFFYFIPSIRRIPPTPDAENHAQTQTSTAFPYFTCGMNRNVAGMMNTRNIIRYKWMIKIVG